MQVTGFVRHIMNDGANNCVTFGEESGRHNQSASFSPVSSHVYDVERVARKLRKCPEVSDDVDVPLLFAQSGDSAPITRTKPWPSARLAGPFTTCAGFTNNTIHKQNL